MQLDFLLVALPAVTFAAVLIFAVVSRKRVKDMRDDPSAPKSALAKDGPTGSVEDRI